MKVWTWADIERVFYKLVTRVNVFSFLPLVLPLLLCSRLTAFSRNESVFYAFASYFLDERRAFHRREEFIFVSKRIFLRFQEWYSILYLFTISLLLPLFFPLLSSNSFRFQHLDAHLPLTYVHYFTQLISFTHDQTCHFHIVRFSLFTDRADYLFTPGMFPICTRIQMIDRS